LWTKTAFVDALVTERLLVVSAFAKKSGERVAQTVSLRRMRGRTWSHRRLTVCAAVTGVQGAFLISDSMF
jgi:hypothetical protein